MQSTNMGGTATYSLLEIRNRMNVRMDVKNRYSNLHPVDEMTVSMHAKTSRPQKQ